MPILTEERVEDLAKFYQKVYELFRKKGVSIDETLALLTIMMCSIGKKTQMHKEELIGRLESRWDNWEEEEQ